MVEREPAAAGVDRQTSALGRVAVLPQRVALATWREAEHFGGDGGGDRERVVDHRHFHVVGTEAGHLVGGCRRTRRGRGREVLHLHHVLVADGLAGAGDPHRVGREVAGDLGSRDDHGTAVVGHQAAVVEGQRPGDDPGVDHVLDGDRAAERTLRLAVHHGAWIELRPVPGDDRDVSEVLQRRAVVVEVAHHGVRVLRWRPEGTVRHRHLGPRADLPTPATATAAATAAVRPAGFAVADEGDVDDAGMDGGQRMVHVDLERAAANRCGVEVSRMDAEVLGEFAGPAGREHALDVRDRNARVLAYVVDRFDVQLQRGGLVPREFLAIADDVGLCGTDDGRGIGQVR